MSSQYTTSELETILFLRYLATGCPIKTDGTPQKVRQSTKKWGMLYQLYLLHKNVSKGKWNEIFVSIDTLAKWSGCSNSCADRFINSHEISNLIDIKKNPIRKKGRFTTHTYCLKKNVLGAMIFLERKGFFRGMKGDYKKWRSWFNHRMDVWLIPKLEEGFTFRQILEGSKIIRKDQENINILSTENAPKRTAVNFVKEPVRLLGILTTQGYKEHDAISLQFNETLGRLEMLGFSSRQKENFIRNNPLGILNVASKSVEDRLRRKDLQEIRNLGGFLQSKLNILRFGKMRK